MSSIIEKYRSKVLALRNACDELLQDMDKETSIPVRTRQNRREGRILNFDAQYKKRKKKSA